MSLFSPQVIHTLTSVAHHKELRDFSNPRLGSKAFLPSSNPNSGCVSSRIESRIWKRYLHTMFVAALFTVTKRCRHPQPSAADKWINKVWYSYTMEYYATLERKESLTLSTPWMNLVDMMLSEKKHSQKRQMLCDSTSLGSSSSQMHRNRKLGGGLPELGGGDWGLV